MQIRVFHERKLEVHLLAKKHVRKIQNPRLRVNSFQLQSIVYSFLKSSATSYELHNFVYFGVK